MNPRTQTLLQTLENADWFSCVGKRDIADVNYAKSWLDAVSHCVGEDWKYVHREGRSIISSSVYKKSKTRCDQWNDTIDMLKNPVSKLVQRKAASVMELNHLPKEFGWSVAGDLINAALECEYSDVVDPGFFTTTIVDIYLKGHFPCGWEGKYPEGKLVVY